MRRGASAGGCLLTRAMAAHRIPARRPSCANSDDPRQQFGDRQAVRHAPGATGRHVPRSDGDTITKRIGPRDAIRGGSGRGVWENSTMILKQFYLNCLAHASYLIGDEQTRTAAVVDPQRDVDQY